MTVVAAGAIESAMTHISGFERSQILLLPEAVDKRLDEYPRRLDESDVEEAATDSSRTKNLAEKIAALREKRGRYGVLLTELERSGEPLATTSSSRSTQSTR
jgi:hypothetical protein